MRSGRRSVTSIADSIINTSTLPIALARSLPMSLTWGEYWLLESASKARIPFRYLFHPELPLVLNKPGHHLDELEVLDALERLLDRGDLICERDSRGVHRPTRAELAQALAYTRERPRDGLCYGLTAQGGARWEALARVDWSAYVQVGHGEITGVDRARVERALPPGVAAEWDRLEPWPVSPWRTLTAAHRARFAPTDEYHPLPHEPWFTPPEWPRGALYSMPLEDGRRGLVRVIETLPPYRFVILCDAVRLRGEPVPNLSRLARRFMRLGFASWKNALHGGWIEGPPPESFQFEGAVPVTSDELEMALGTWTTATWEGFARSALREWRWREQPVPEPVVPSRPRKVERSAEELAEIRERERARRAAQDALRARLRELQPPEPPEVRERWSKRVNVERFGSKLEEAFRRLLSRNLGAGERTDRYEVRVTPVSSDGTELDLTLGFRAGETYCCMQWGCHLGLYDRGVWDAVRERLRERAPGLDPPLLTIRQLIVEVAPGARFDGIPGIREETVSGPLRFECGTWREADVLRSTPRLRER